jgi:ankyrin repeat protein
LFYLLFSLLILEQQAAYCIYEMSLEQELISAAQQGNSSQLEHALSHGVFINAKNRYDMTALHYAASNNLSEIVGRLITCGANVQAQNVIRATPLHYAAYKGHAKVVILLLNSKAPINARDYKGNTPLHCAAHNGHVEVVEQLILYGASIRKCNELFFSPLHYAVFNNKLTIVEKLLIYYDFHEFPIPGQLISHPTLLRAQNNSRYMQQAIKEDTISKVLELLRNGAYITTRVKLYYVDKTKELLQAVADNNTDKAKQLFKGGCSLKSKDTAGNTLLHIAILYKSRAVIELLLSLRGSSTQLDKKNKQGLTPIEIAFTTSTSHIEFLRELLQVLESN